MNHKKLRRIYRQEGLQVRKRDVRKRALGSGTSIRFPDVVNRSEALDSVSEFLSDGQRSRILTVVDDYS